MNEEQLSMLSTMGYTYTQGNIIDASGNFVSSVDLPSGAVYSMGTEDSYKKQKIRNEEASSSGFVEDKNSNESLYTQQEKFMAEKNISDYLTSSDKVPLEDTSYTQFAFEKYKEQGLIQEDSLEALRSNKNHFSEDLNIRLLSELAPENIESLKHVKNEIKKIESFDMDQLTIEKKHRENLDKELEENSSYNPVNIGIYIGKAMSHVRDSFYDVGEGIENEQIRKIYIDLKKQEKKLKEPVNIHFLDKVKKAEKVLYKKMEEKMFVSDYFVNSTTDEENRLLAAYNNLAGAGNALEDYLNGSSLYNPFNAEDLVDFGTLGFNDVLFNNRFKVQITNKLNRNEDLTEAEKTFIETQALIDDINSLGNKQKALYEITQGAAESAKFLGGGSFGRIVGKGLSKKILARAFKSTGSKFMAKTAAVTGNIAPQIALHSNTYNQAMERYAGNVKVVETPEGKIEYITDKRTYDTLKEEYQLIKRPLYTELGNLERNGGDQKRIKEIKTQLSKIEQMESELKEPETVFSSVMYGITETAKEVIAEQYAGRLLKNKAVKKLTNKLTKAVGNTKAYKVLANNKIIRGLNNGKNYLNNIGGVAATGKTIGGIGEEIWEEIVVQATPTYGQNWDEYKQQASELLESDFYLKVAGQTLLMQGTMRGGANLYQAATRTKEIKAQRKMFKEISKQLKDKNISQKQQQELLMRIGEGSFSTQEYNNRILALRQKGKNSEANDLERTKLFKMAMAAEKAGKGDQFKRGLRTSLGNKNLTPETVANTHAIIQELDAIQENLENTSTYENRNEVLEFLSKKRYTEKQISEIDNELEVLNSNEKLTEDQTQRKELLEKFKSPLQQTKTDLERRIKVSTSLKNQVKLIEEDKLAKEINLINKKAFNNKMGEQDLQKVRDKIESKYSKKLDVSSVDKVFNAFTQNIRMQKTLNKMEKQIKIAEEAAANNPTNTNTNSNTNSITPEVTPESVKNTIPTVETQNSTVENTSTTTERKITPETSEAPKTPEEVTEYEKAVIEYLATTAEAGPSSSTNNNNSNDGLEFDFLLPNEEGDFDQVGLEQMAEKAKNIVARHVRDFGKEPTFDEFVKALLNNIDNNKDAIKDHFESIGLSWELAGFGKSNWVNSYNKLYNSINDAVTDFLDVAGVNVTEKPKTLVEVIEHQEKAQKEVLDNSKIEPVAENPDTGKPIKVKSNGGTTATTKSKANYSAVEYILEKIETPEGTIIEYKNAPIPVLNQSNYIDFKHLVNPNKNNIGDKLSARVVERAEWSEVKVANRDASGEVLSYVTFDSWVTDNLPSGMNINEFSGTPQFQEKVPIVYVDSQGNPVAFVPEVEWYNPLTVQDSTKEVGEPVNINSPTSNHINQIETAKKVTRTLRNQIISGEVTEVKITDNTSSPLIEVAEKDKDGNKTPLPSLAEVAPDSTIVSFTNDGNLIDLDGNVIDTSQIDSSETLLETVTTNNDKGMSMTRYKNAGSTFYLSHVNTVDGVKIYKALHVLRQNENGENRAYTEDITTAQYLYAAHHILAFGNTESGSSILNNPEHSFNIGVEQAKSLQTQIKNDLGIDIADPTAVLGYLKSLMSVEVNGSLSVSLKDFANSLYTNKGVFYQNTNRHNKVPKMVKIDIKDGKVQSEIIAESYDAFLKSRLTTNIMSFNVGTKTNPVYTSAVQQTVIVEPVIDDTKTLIEEVQEVKESQEVKNKVETLEQTEIPKKLLEDVMALAATLNIDLEGIEEESSDDMIVAELEDTNNISGSITTTKNLLINQEQEVVAFLLSLLSKKDIAESEIKVKFEEEFLKKKQEVQKQIGAIQEVLDKNKNEKLQNILDKFLDAEIKLENVLDNYSTLLNKAREKAEKSSFITEDFQTEEEIVLNEKDFSGDKKSPIDKVGTALKRIFAQINNGQKGFMGVPKFDSFKTMYDTSLAILSTDVSKKPNFETMMAKLLLYKDSHPWIETLVTELRNSPVDVQNQFVYNGHKKAVRAKFATLEVRKSGGINSSLFDSNANSAERVIQTKWKNNFKRSKLNKKGFIDNKQLEKLADQWNEFGDKPFNADPKLIRAWLGEFGIKVSDKTWEAIQQGKLVTRQNKKRSITPYETLFLNSGQRGPNIFSSLAVFAFENKDKTDLDFINNDTAHPFKEMGEILKQLAKLEAKHNPTYISSTRRVGGKTLPEVESMTHFYSQVDKLKNSALTDKQYLKELASLSFSENSMLLELLQNDQDFAENFDSGFYDIVSLKELGKQDPMFAGIDELSGLDYMFAQRAMLQNKRQGKIESTYKGFNLRFGHVSTPTNSDKGRMMLLKTAVFDLYAQSKKAFIKNEKGEFIFTKDLQEVLYTQLVEPEVKRAIKKAQLGKSNIKGYDKGASRINLVPGVNLLTSSNGTTVFEALNIGSTEYTAEMFKEQYFDKIVKHLEGNITTEAKANLKTLERFKQEEKVAGGKVTDTFNNENYLNARQAPVEENMMVAELDYIINSMIANVNTFQTIAGDPALYYKSKISPEDKTVAAQEKISMELGINLGKRLAVMIAPGDVLADSDSNSYLQIFMQDPEDVAENIKEILGWHYGTEVLQEIFNGKTYEEHINNLKSGNIEGDVLKHLEIKFSQVKDFFSIESADAQEYTTTKEHLYVLRKQGRISDELHKTVQERLAAQKKAEKEGNKIPKDALLTKEELNLVLQPIKPVYTGTMLDGNQDVNRMLYIKSSSFPLIPQLTVSRKLDKLRKKMEELEDFGQTTVRASYQTANKVGALTNPINPFNDKSLEELNNGEGKSYLKLDRANFKIQQDVPFKSEKLQDDSVSMGTQIFKLLFGDEILDINNFQVNGKKMSGKELQKMFFDTFSEMVNIKRSKLLKKLGLDNNMKSKDAKKTAEAFQKMITKEAKERGFSDQDLKALTLESKTDVNDKEYYHFKLPLWFSANSNKYESMFNAIINNKILQQKIPGNSFVAGSEAGMQMTEDLSQIDTSRVVHLNGYEGGELRGASNAEKGINKAQVMLPSKFKLGGKLIDIYEDFNGTEGKYIQRNEKGILEIKNDMIDPKLLEMFSFRIPTSSHGLGSAIEVVGFLPPETGDLIVTPKNFITQMGQDFDVDKLTAYQYNHLVMPNGEIKMLTEENKKEFIEAQEQVLNELQKELFYEDKYGEFLNNVLALFPEANLGVEYNKEDALSEIAQIKKELSKDFDLKLAENNFIKIHTAIYTNPKTQAKINKVLSMEFAEAQADGIEAITSKKTNTFNILSPNYQMNKMNLGATGGTGIGIYAKGVTFHSLTQQATETVRLTENTGEDVVNKIIRIGKVESQGDFGKTNTIAKEDANDTEKKLVRKISTSLDERTNTATDNEKAQILGRVGLNSKDAIAVDNLLAVLGIDAEINMISKEEYDSSNPFHKTSYVDGNKVYYTEHSLPYLLHSQPIIKEYFKRVAAEESVTTGYTEKVKEKILTDLIKEQLGEDYTIKDGEILNKAGDSIQDNSKFTAETLLSEVQSGGSNNTQTQVLAFYIDLIKQAKKTKDLMSVVDMSNLGKSMWESSIKSEEFKNLLINEEKMGISGAASLLGTHRLVSKGIELNPGELDLGGGFYFTPTTNQGVMVGNALSLSENLFNDYFPSKDTYINQIIDNILGSSNVNIGNSNALIKAKEQIFQEIKKYLTSAQHNGLFNTNAKAVRENLFIDSENNKSLSSYIGGLLEGSSTSKGIEALKNNKFLSIMSYEIGENGKPSIIKFNNAEAFDVSEEHIYNAFKELIINDYALPNRNGKPYSTKMLAQEMVAYSFASGGIVQGAIQFHKFIPIEYLDDLTTTTKGVKIPVTRLLQQYDSQNSNWGAVGKNGKQRLTDFERQFFQNNPEQASKYTEKVKVVSKDVVEIKSDKNFVVVKQKTASKLKQDKYKIYEKVGKNLYAEIPVLGEHGMSEYEYGNENLSSSLKKNKLPKVSVQNNIETIQEGKVPEKKLNINSKSTVKEVLNQILSLNMEENKNMAKIAEFLMPYIDESNITIEIVNNPNENFAGRNTINKDGTNTLKLNVAKIGGKDVNVAQTFLHELIHSLTSNAINNSLDADDNLLPGAMAEIGKLNILFKEYTKRIEEAYKESGDYKTFLKKYQDYQDNKKKNPKDRIPVGFTTKEKEVFYPTINLKEFIATALGNNKGFIEEASSMTYLRTDSNILQKFSKIIVDLLNRISSETKKTNTLAEEVLYQSFEVINEVNEETKEKNTMLAEMEVTSQEMQKISQQEIDADMEAYQEMYANQGNIIPDDLPGIERTTKNCRI